MSDPITFLRNVLGLALGLVLAVPAAVVLWRAHQRQRRHP